MQLQPTAPRLQDPAPLGLALNRLPAAVDIGVHRFSAVLPGRGRAESNVRRVADGIIEYCQLDNCQLLHAEDCWNCGSIEMYDPGARARDFKENQVGNLDLSTSLLYNLNYHSLRAEFILAWP